MPPPMPTMATPSSVPLNFEVRARNGLPNSRAESTPATTATPAAWLRNAGQAHGPKKKNPATARNASWAKRVLALVVDMPGSE